MNIRKPTLLIDESRCRENIRRMASKARRHNLEFRPHFKTHQSLEIGRWFKDYGVDKITVSSVEMAEYFAGEWNDITIAFPVNILETDPINELASKINLNLLIESEETAAFLKNNLTSETGFFIKIDLGNHRTGLDPEDTISVDKILEITDSSKLLKFKGFLGHAGHTYYCSTADEVNSIQSESMRIMKGLKKKYIERYPGIIISTGDTPGCSISEDFSGTDEIRPGNFIFYDLMQLKAGACREENIAAAMACPVVAVHRERNEIVIYGGGIHFSKDRMEDGTDGTIYGRAAENDGNGWGKIIRGMYLKSLSQEHGIMKVPDEKINEYNAGDIIVVIPVHSCMTADVMKSYLTLEGKMITMMKK